MSALCHSPPTEHPSVLVSHCCALPVSSLVPDPEYLQALQSQGLQKAEQLLAGSSGDLCGLMNVNFSRTLPAWAVLLSIERLRL